MKSVRIHSFGGPEVMRLEEIQVPDPGDDELLVQVRAASVNPVDYKTRDGQYPRVTREQLPVTLGRDIAGVVVDSGGLRGSFMRGDAIYALLRPEQGAFAEYVLVNRADAAPKPERLSFIEAASVPLAALTAWQGLFDHGGLKPGQSVLIHGGAGGVGHFAIQFAKYRRAEVITTVSGDDIEFARELGADEAIDYKNLRFEDIVRDVDMVFDLVGGETQERSWQVLKRNGILVSTLGAPPPQRAEQNKVRAVGYLAQPNAGQLAEIGRLIDQGLVHPRVDTTYTLEQAPEAEERQAQGHVHSKLVLEIAA
jgi:NADPH:quinone reductase-like Zn-dependent oxidoreductase